MAAPRARQATIDRLTEYLAEHALSQTRAATLIGVSASTLSEVIKGTYKGSGTSVFKLIRRWLDFEERRRWEPLEVEPVATSAYRMIEAACRYAHEKGVGALVLADAGAGKTTALKKYALDSPQAHYIECDQTMRGRGRLVRAIGQAVYTRRKTRTVHIWDDIIDTLHGTRGCLLLDDAQYLGTLSLNAVQKLHDKTGVGFVLAGVDLLHSEMARGRDAEWFAQLRSRCALMRSFDVRKMSRKDALAVATALAALHGKELAPDAENILLEEARRPGGLRRVKQIVGLAATLAKSGAVAPADIDKAIQYRGGI